jgi:phospholipase/carboxylesterase
MSADGSEARPQLFRAGSGAGPVLLMLHGTGGDEHDIASLAERIDPSATVLAVRGRVVEQGMNRWFHRRAEGVFDVDSVRTEAASLAGFLTWARERYGLEGRDLVGVGFSNGANMALATAMLHPDALTRVVAFSGMHPLGGEDPGRDLGTVEALLLNGSDDRMAPASSVDALERTLRDRNAAVTRLTRAGGHGITAEELASATEWIAAR